MFLVNSRHGNFRCVPSRAPREKIPNYKLSARADQPRAGKYQVNYKFQLLKFQTVLNFGISSFGAYLLFGTWCLEFPCAKHKTGKASSKRTPSFFAEFLREQSPIGLRLLALSTCVGFGTGSLRVILGTFLGSMLG